LPGSTPALPTLTGPGITRRRKLRLLSAEHAKLCAVATMTGLSLATCATLAHAAILVQCAPIVPGAVVTAIKKALIDWRIALEERADNAEERVDMVKRRKLIAADVVTWAEILGEYEEEEA
jgi:hypothetical protein